MLIWPRISRARLTTGPISITEVAGKARTSPESSARLSAGPSSETVAARLCGASEIALGLNTST